MIGLREPPRLPHAGASIAAGLRRILTMYDDRDAVGTPPITRGRPLPSHRSWHTRLWHTPAHAQAASKGAPMLTARASIECFDTSVTRNTAGRVSKDRDGNSRFHVGGHRSSNAAHEASRGAHAVGWPAWHRVAVARRGARGAVLAIIHEGGHYRVRLPTRNLNGRQSRGHASWQGAYCMKGRIQWRIRAGQQHPIERARRFLCLCGAYPGGEVGEVIFLGACLPVKIFYTLQCALTHSAYAYIVYTNNI